MLQILAGSTVINIEGARGTVAVLGGDEKVVTLWELETPRVLARLNCADDIVKVCSTNHQGTMTAFVEVGNDGQRRLLADPGGSFRPQFARSTGRCSILC